MSTREDVFHTVKGEAKSKTLNVDVSSITSIKNGIRSNTLNPDEYWFEFFVDDSFVKEEQLEDVVRDSKGSIVMRLSPKYVLPTAPSFAQELVNCNFKLESGYEVTLNKFLGGGKESIVYAGVNERGAIVVVKFESANAKLPQLETEKKALENLSGCRGVPHLIDYSLYEGYRVLVTDKLGTPLETQRKSVVCYYLENWV